MNSELYAVLAIAAATLVTSIVFIVYAVTGHDLCLWCLGR
jgi:hypothetical protein